MWFDLQECLIPFLYMTINLKWVVWYSELEVKLSNSKCK